MGGSFIACKLRQIILLQARSKDSFNPRTRTGCDSNIDKILYISAIHCLLRECHNIIVHFIYAFDMPLDLIAHNFKERDAFTNYPTTPGSRNHNIRVSSSGLKTSFVPKFSTFLSQLLPRL